MTTTPEKNPFPPKKPVPVGDSIIIHYSGKPPKPSVREYEGQKIYEVTFWCGIADVSYPDVHGQYHPLTMRSWICPQRQIEVEGKPKTIQPSKLYKTIEAIAGKEVAEKFAYHDASITEAEIAAETDANRREKLQERFVDPEWWKPLRGFYIAKFKEPRKDKETGGPRFAEDGGILRQEVLELEPLKAARITTDEQLQANIIWPPGKPEVGKPTPTNNAAAGPQPPVPPNEEPKAPTKEPDPEVCPISDEAHARLVAQVKGYHDKKAGYGFVIKRLLDQTGGAVGDLPCTVLYSLVDQLALAERFLHRCGKAHLGNLDDKQQALLKVLLQIQELQETTTAAARLREYLAHTNKPLEALDKSEAELIEQTMRNAAAADDDIPF